MFDLKPLALFVSICAVYMSYMNIRRRADSVDYPQMPEGFFSHAHTAEVIKIKFGVDVVIAESTVSSFGNRRTVFISDTSYGDLRQCLGDTIYSLHGEGINNVYVRTTLEGQKETLKSAISALYTGWDVYEVTDDGMSDVLGESEFACSTKPWLKRPWTSIDGKLVRIPNTETFEDEL
jgi:hypothetical protein